jgi:hypothetical protein
LPCHARQGQQNFFLCPFYEEGVLVLVLGLVTIHLEKILELKTQGSLRFYGIEVRDSFEK